MGASQFSDEDAEWTVWPGQEPEFSPTERYFLLPFAKAEKEWEEVLSIVTEATRAFLISPKGGSSYLSQAEAVTVGFDDGDLVRVK